MEAGVGWANGLFCGNSDLTSDAGLMVANGLAGFESADEAVVNVVETVGFDVAIFAKGFDGPV